MSGRDGGSSNMAYLPLVDNVARKVPMPRVIALAAMFCMVLCGLLFWSAPVFALEEHVFSGSFGGEGSAGGQFFGPAGVAVSQASGDVYVVDSDNNRVEQFTSSGVFVLEFNGSSAPAGPFESPEGIAVDNSVNPLDPSAGDVYVADVGHHVIDKFSSTGAYIGELKEASPGVPFERIDGVAVDPNGVLWVYQENNEIDKFSDALANGFVLKREAPFAPFSGQPGLAVDSEDSLYIAHRVAALAKLDGEGNLVRSEMAPNEEVTGVGVDLSNDNVYLANGSTPVDAHSVVEFNSSGSLVYSFGSAQLNRGGGVAVYAPTHKVYVTDSNADVVDIFSAVVVPSVSTGSASEVHERSADVSGVVNPSGILVGSCMFEYGTTTGYGQSVPCVSSPGSGEESVQVGAALSGLEPSTVYHYRLVAANANGENQGQDETFTTPGLVKIDGQFVADVTSRSATLEAQINPGGADTSYRFEYGATTLYGTVLPVPEGNAGAGLSDVTENVHVQGLEPSTLYDFRVVATNSIGMAEVHGSFTTQPEGVVFALPDARQYELVSPPDKLGATLEPLTSEGVEQASESGDAFSYLANGPVVPDPAGSVQEGSQIFSGRAAGGGWSTQDIATPHDTANEGNVGIGREYRAFSLDLSLGLVEPIGGTLLSPAATEPTLYLRDVGGGGYLPLVTAANVPDGTKFSESGGVRFVTATPDLSHVLLTSEVPLTGTSANFGGYEWTAGNLTLADVLPNGKSDKHFAGFGFESYDVRHAIANDGSRVFWESIGGPSGEVSGFRNLYMRDMTRGETVQVDAAQGVAETAEPESVFQAASADGSRVFFTDGASLTPTSTAGGSSERDLYVFEVADGGGKLHGTLTDLTVAKNPGEHANVMGTVLGTSEDGSYVYIVAGGVLTEVENGRKEKAQPGADNLYVLHDEGVKWTPTFIARLTATDMPDWEEPSGNGHAEHANLAKVTSRVSPSGHYLAFMSNSSLTGYDNSDVYSGRQDEEVFLYEALSEHLTCASCNPTGARPVGILDRRTEGVGPLVDAPGVWQGRWLAASIPGWTAVNIKYALYQSRYLSDEGRLFFNSPGALVPQDTNGVEDVYEYEPNKVGSCKTEEGCVALISGGASDDEAAFLDASASGDDVFFLTAAKLLPQDYDTTFDVYDAHVCSTIAPCPPVPAAAPSVCATSESCRPTPFAQLSILGAPASTVFVGPGSSPLPVSKAVKHKKSRNASKKKSKHKKNSKRKHKRRSKKSKRATAKRSLSGRGRR